MATVYLAEDLKHHRNVALKVLHPELAAVLGAERFLAEIRTTANLQHPHILPLHDSGQADGLLFYVMPYVEGETLRARLSREQQLPIDDAIRITREVASALDYAHRHGVIHRDIKPENILLDEGQALIADFGIALAVSSAGSQRMTQTGMSLGTPEYMSPEQALGERTVTARSDIYALGCVLYEMLTGEPPFTGATVQAIVAKVMHERPVPPSSIRDTVPPQVEAAVLKALAKLPADRFTTPSEFAARLVTTSADSGFPGAASFNASLSRWKQATTGLAGLALVLLVALVVIATRTGSPPRTARVEVEAGGYFGSLNVPVVVGAPDGSSLAYCSSEGELWTRRWESLAPRRVPDAGTGCLSAAFSPDGRQLAVIGIPTSLHIVSLAGDSPPRVLSVSGLDDLNLSGGGIDWASDGNLYIASRRGVTRVSPTDGHGTVVATMDSAVTKVAGIDVLPGAKAALVVVTTPSPTGSQIQRVGVVDLRSGKTELILLGNAVRYAKPGYLLVARDGILVAVPFDLASLRPSGPEVPLADSIAVRLRAGLGLIDVTDDGTLLYFRSAGTDLSHPVFVDRAGGVKEINPPQWIGRLAEPRLSNDDALLAMEVNDGVRSEAWIRDLRSGQNTVVATGGLVNGRHEWKQPDGRALTIVSTRSGSAALYEWPLSGGALKALPGYDPRPIFGAAWSRDGQWLLLRTDDQSEGRGDILAVRPGVDSVAVPVVAAPEYSEYSPALSPDGKWLAYVSNETGRYEVRVTPFPDARWQLKISDGGATDPLWSHSGRELFFISQGYLMAADIASEPGFRVVGQRRLFDITPFLGGSFARRNFDITSDDQRFVMLRRNADLMTTRIVAVFNWASELTSRVKR